MEAPRIDVGGVPIRAHAHDAIVLGSGAAGLCAALRLRQLGQDVALVTEGMGMGTSRNTGSDKQTYYKLTLCGGAPDSPLDMARDLFGGKCVDGDVALVEAALSARAFHHLCELGVPFPVNRWGEAVGYKTDHDPRARATSAGPLTSRMMTECLERAVRALGIPIYDGYQAIALLRDEDAGREGRACGLLALSKDGIQSEETRFALFFAHSTVLATGGPAGIYEDTVYPASQNGGSGMAFEAGIRGRNLTEWQYGLASVAPRWNVSGTYMQVLPRFVSVDPDGAEREFLMEYFASPEECLNRVFLKGYEWPFDSRKALHGSSLIDLLVFRERVLRGRRVYLDYRANPQLLTDLPFHALNAEARDYLEDAGAGFGAPIDRLLHMNRPAYELYRSKGVDLRRERLEIALCAQHHNGGLDIDLWFRTNVPGCYAIGEAAGSHGVYRPGGSALNAGQVGALRAAQHIAARKAEPAPTAPGTSARETIQWHIDCCRQMLRGSDTVRAEKAAATRRMSGAAGALRSARAICEALGETDALLDRFAARVAVSSAEALCEAYRLRDILLTQRMILSAMLDYLGQGGASRGSALYTDASGEKPAGMEDLFRFTLDRGEKDGHIQLATMRGGMRTSPGGERAGALDNPRDIACHWRPVNPLPEGGGVFETVWRAYREHGNIE